MYKGTIHYHAVQSIHITVESMLHDICISARGISACKADSAVVFKKDLFTVS